jgi:hypothetical protein
MVPVMITAPPCSGSKSIESCKTSRSVAGRNPAEKRIDKIHKRIGLYLFFCTYIFPGNRSVYCLFCGNNGVGMDNGIVVKARIKNPVI